MDKHDMNFLYFLRKGKILLQFFAYLEEQNLISTQERRKLK